jgi:hypothetical protein
MWQILAFVLFIVRRIFISSLNFVILNFNKIDPTDLLHPSSAPAICASYILTYISVPTLIFKFFVAIGCKPSISIEWPFGTLTTMLPYTGVDVWQCTSIKSWLTRQIVFTNDHSFWSIDCIASLDLKLSVLEDSAPLLYGDNFNITINQRNKNIFYIT